MPRQNVYMKQKTLDGIRQLVDERLAEGATPADVNMSSVCSELLETGLRVVQQLKKREQEEEKNGGLTDEELFRKRLLEECMKSRLTTQAILNCMFDLTEIKSDSRHNYHEMISKFHLLGKYIPHARHGLFNEWHGSFSLKKCLFVSL